MIEESDVTREIIGEGLLAATVSKHRSIMNLWNIENVYHVSLAIFPSKAEYDRIPLPEIMTGPEENIPVKILKIEGNAHDKTHITFFGNQP